MRTLAAIALIITVWSAPAALGRDLTGRFATTQLKTWFDNLASKKGYCCSNADGQVLSDVDWETFNNHFRVRIDGNWVDVPDDALVTEPNRAGVPMVWPLRGTDGLTIRCFMPGPFG